MDFKMQKKQLEDLLSLLVRKDTVTDERRGIRDAYERGLESASKRGLPVAPTKPKEPKMPHKQKYAAVDTSLRPKDFLLGYVSIFARKLSKKKQEKEVAETNARIDKEYAEKMAQYEKDMAKWKKDMDAYTAAYAKWEKDLKKKTDDNSDKYRQDNTHVLEQVKQLDAELADLNSQIDACKILSSKDKNLEVVLYISNKLDTGRADSVMMALNMYDMEKRQEAQFRARMEADAFDRRMEADRRKQWEAEQSMKQWNHNRQMEEYARETRNYERDQAKALEEIRKTTERN